MADKLIFLSHIHEEKDLAVAIKTALENEFGGFVDVFVSSDGTSIPAGANFLKRIEDGLVQCVGAVYLLSPASVKRSWVHFELGAVWVRNAMNLRANGVEIPALPMCHSGMTPSAMPSPLNHLNGIVANQAPALEFAFRSLQAAVGGSGKLKTDFDALAKFVAAFEQIYTTGANVVKAIKLAVLDPSNFAELIAHAAAQPAGPTIQIDCGFIEMDAVKALRQMEASELKGILTVNFTNAAMVVGTQGAATGGSVVLQLPAAEILKVKDLLK